VPRLRHLALALLVPVALAGCGAQRSSSSAGKFSGEQKQVAQTVDDLATAGQKSDEKTVCGTLLSRALVARLNAGGSTCLKAVGDQIDSADSFTLKVESVAVTGSRATAQVTSTVSGHDAKRTLSFVREGGGWRVSGLG
jgi:hypothetical protein